MRNKFIYKMDSTIDTKFSGPQFLPNGSKTNSEGYDKILIKYTHSLLVHSMNTTDVYYIQKIYTKDIYKSEIYKKKLWKPGFTLIS